MQAHIERRRIGNDLVRQVVTEQGEVLDTKVIPMGEPATASVEADQTAFEAAQFDDFLAEGDSWAAFDAARASAGQHLLGAQKGREEFNQHVDAKNALDKAKEDVTYRRENRSRAERQAKRAGANPYNDPWVQKQSAAEDQAKTTRDAAATQVKSTVTEHPEKGQFTPSGRVGTNAPSYFHVTPSGPVYKSPSGDEVSIAHQTELRLRDAHIPESTTVNYRGADGKSASWSFSSGDSARSHASKMFGISR